MAMLLLRYRTAKPTDGVFHFDLHGGAQVVGFTELWHSDNGWEVYLDVVGDSDAPVERRYFMVATGGTNLTALGEYPAAYHVASHESKGYCSYLFELTQLSETEREDLRRENPRLGRPRPALEDMGRRQQAVIVRDRERKQQAKRPAAKLLTADELAARRKSDPEFAQDGTLPTRLAAAFHEADVCTCGHRLSDHGATVTHCTRCTCVEYRAREVAAENAG